MNRTIGVLTVFFALATSVSFAQNAHVDYTPATGNIVFRSLSWVQGLALTGPGVPAVTPDSLGGFVDTSIPNEVYWLFFLRKQGDVDVGNLLPMGLLQTEIEANYFAGYDVSQGYPLPFPLPIYGGLVEEVPEPSTLILLLSAFATSFRWRRS